MLGLVDEQLCAGGRLQSPEEELKGATRHFAAEEPTQADGFPSLLETGTI